VGGDYLAGGDGVAGADGMAGGVAGTPSNDPIRRMTGVRRANETRPWLVRQSGM